MRRTIRTTAVAAISAATVLAGPTMAAHSHDGGTKGAKSARGTKSASSAASHKARVISALVTAGTITQAQGTAVNAAIKASTAPRSTSDAQRRTKYNTITAPLVANATITRAQADAIVNAIVADGAAKAASGSKGSRGSKGSTATTIKQS